MSAVIIHVHPLDGVAVALQDLAAGTVLPRVGVDGGVGAVTGGGATVTVRQPVPRGHKVALRAHPAGDEVRKFGHVIGHATADIAPGEWVHSHNLATGLGPQMTLQWSAADAREASVPAIADLLARGAPGSAEPGGDEPHWMGYDRGAHAATRNEIWILPTVGCVARTAQRVADLAGVRHAGRVDGVHAFTHPHGCSQLGSDLDGTRRLLAQLAAHPNAGGVLLLGLGCESNQVRALIEAMPTEARTRMRHVVAQDSEDEMAAALSAVDALVDVASSARRTPQPLSRLRIGLKCGGSDGFSGLTANPLLGRLSERIAAAGGGVILSEIPEIFGAEAPLLRRAASQGVFDAALTLVNDLRAYFVAHGQPVSENPSPGNIAGGITTLEEKSLGAVQKAGRVPLTAVARYGDRAEAAGLTLLEAPGNDAVSSTALAAAGANLLLFTTGRGTPLGFPVPTVKVASNSALAARKSGWIDFDAGAALDGDIDALDRAFMERLLAIASGAPTAAEKNGQREIAIWKRGVTL